MKIRIRIRMHRKLLQENMLFFVALFCVSSFALLEHVSISIPAFSVVKNPLLYTAGICIALNSLSLLKVLKKKKYFYVILMVLVFCLGLYFSTSFTKNTIAGAAHQRATIRLALYLIELFFLMLWAAETGRSRYVINFLFWFFLILTLATDLLLFTGFVVFQNGQEISYLVGTKFTVAYYHINLLTFWFMRNRQTLFSDKRARRILWVGLPLTIYMSVYVECLTGIIGCVFMLTTFKIMSTTSVQKKIVQLNSPAVLVTALMCSMLFPFLAEQVVSIPAVTNFVQNILNKSANLTGRVNIYTAFAESMQGHWLWGYGYGNANLVSKLLFGYANAQNGLLQWVLQIGIPAVALLVLLMVTILRRLNRSRQVVQAMPIVVLIYLYIVLGMIETTYDMNFLLWFALLFLISAENNSSVQKAT